MDKTQNEVQKDVTITDKINDMIYAFHHQTVESKGNLINETEECQKSSDDHKEAHLLLNRDEQNKKNKNQVFNIFEKNSDFTMSICPQDQLEKSAIEKEVQKEQHFSHSIQTNRQLLQNDNKQLENTNLDDIDENQIQNDIQSQDIKMDDSSKLTFGIGNLIDSDIQKTKASRFNRIQEKFAQNKLKRGQSEVSMRKSSSLLTRNKTMILSLFQKYKPIESRINIKGLWKHKTRILIHILNFYKIIKKINLNSLRKKKPPTITHIFSDNFQRRNKWFPLSPGCRFKSGWNVLMFFTLISMAFITPFSVCIVDQQSLDDSFLLFLDFLFDIIFGIDIIVHFLSAYQDNKNKIIYSPLLIFKNYITTWFLIDTIATFPFNLLSSSSSAYNKLLRLLRLPRLYSLTKLIKLNRGENYNLISKIQDGLKMNIASRQLLNLFFMTLILSHIVSCLWYLTSRLDNFSGDTWVTRLRMEDNSAIEKYIVCLYWAFQTLFVIGYGDIGAYTIYEQILSIVWMIFSVGFYSFVISNLSSLIIQANKRQNMLKETLESIDQIQAQCFLPPTLVKRMKKFYEINYEKNIFFRNQE